MRTLTLLLARNGDATDLALYLASHGRRCPDAAATHLGRRTVTDLHIITRSRP